MLEAAVVHILEDNGLFGVVTVEPLVLRFDVRVGVLRACGMRLACPWVTTIPELFQVRFKVITIIDYYCVC